MLTWRLGTTSARSSNTPRLRRLLVPVLIAVQRVVGHRKMPWFWKVMAAPYLSAMNRWHLRIAYARISGTK